MNFFYFWKTRKIFVHGKGLYKTHGFPKGRLVLKNCESLLVPENSRKRLITKQRYFYTHLFKALKLFELSTVVPLTKKRPTLAVAFLKIFVRPQTSHSSLLFEQAFFTPPLGLVVWMRSQQAEVVVWDYKSFLIFANLDNSKGHLKRHCATLPPPLVLN